MINRKKLSFIADYMVTRNETLSIAESVSAGRIASVFSLATNASFFFQGGITAYNLGQKTRHLNIDPILGERCNCVEEAIAQQMARGVASLFSSHWGIAITGYAVPVPALKIKSCFAFYSFYNCRGAVVTGRIDTKRKGQASVQEFFTMTLIDNFISHLRTIETT